MTTNPLPLISVHGKPYERGLQHGRQCGDLIARYADTLIGTIALESSWRALPQAASPLRREDLLRRALAFLPQMEAFAPHLIEEIRGIADGARIPFAEALLCNVRAEVIGVKDAGCTSFAIGRAATADGAILTGQNQDQSPLNRDLQIVLHVEPEDGPAILMVSFAGLVGYPGLNSAGVTCFQNALSTPTWSATGLPHYLLKRVLLEQDSLEGCLSVFGRARLCSSGNYVLTDRDDAIDVEATPEGYHTLRPSDDIVVHTNHFLHPSLVEHDALIAGMPDSACRVRRMRELLVTRHGAISVGILKEFLADHENRPTSICRHEEGMITIASIIAEPDCGRLHVARGNPCENAYTTYSL